MVVPERFLSSGSKKYQKGFLDVVIKKGFLLVDPKSMKRFHYGGTKKPPCWWY